MNIKKIILGAAMLVGLTVASRAQNPDAFRVPRTVVLAPIATLSTIGTTTVTNGPIDLGGFDGIVSVDLAVITNAAGITQIAKLETGNNGTNDFNTVTNFGLSTSTALSFTNYFPGGSFGSNVCVNTTLLPGTWVTPTAFSSGFSTPYFLECQFTNQQLTVSKGNYHLGLIAPSKRYLRIIWDNSGSAAPGTNVTVNATVTGLPKWPM